MFELIRENSVVYTYQLSPKGTFPWFFLIYGGTLKILEKVTLYQNKTLYKTLYKKMCSFSQ